MRKSFIHQILCKLPESTQMLDNLPEKSHSVCSRLTQKSLIWLNDELLPSYKFFGGRTWDVWVMTMVAWVTLQKFEGIGYSTKPVIKWQLITGAHRYWQCLKWNERLPFLALGWVICRNNSRIEYFQKQVTQLNEMGEWNEQILLRKQSMCIQ